MNAIYADETNLIKSEARFDARRTLDRITPEKLERRARNIARAHGASACAQQVADFARSVYDMGGDAEEALNRAREYAIDLATSPGSAA